MYVIGLGLVLPYAIDFALCKKPCGSDVSLSRLGGGGGRSLSLFKGIVGALEVVGVTSSSV
jgi:hypothetical protein